MIDVKETKPVICDSCGADEMGCQVKRGLAGRPCCTSCGHTPTTRGTTQ